MFQQREMNAALLIVFAIVNSIEFTFRKYKNMKMAIWQITTHFLVEGHKY